MTDAASAWPRDPGVPLNAEQDGWHWTVRIGGVEPVPEFWDAQLRFWPYFSGLENDYRYLGPCLSPAEVAQLRAENEQLRAGRAAITRREREAELRVLEAAAMLAERIELAREGTRPPVSKALRAELARRRSETGK